MIIEVTKHHLEHSLCTASVEKENVADNCLISTAVKDFLNKGNYLYEEVFYVAGLTVDISNWGMGLTIPVNDLSRDLALHFDNMVGLVKLETAKREDSRAFIEEHLPHEIHFDESLLDKLKKQEPKVATAYICSKCK